MASVDIVKGFADHKNFRADLLISLLQLAHSYSYD